MKKYIMLGIAVIICILLGVIFSFTQYQREVHREKVDEAVVVIGNEIIEDGESILVEGENIYLPIEFIKKYFDPNINVSEDGKRAYINLSHRDFEMEEDSLTKFIDGKDIEINIPLKREEHIHYLPLSQLGKIFSIDVSYNEKSNRVIIDEFSGEERFGIIKYDKVKVYSHRTLKIKTADILNQGDRVKVLSEDGNLYRVRTDKGYFGYVEKKYTEEGLERIEYDSKINSIREEVEDKERINITWEYVYEKTPDISKEEKIQGLDVISPTWFSLSQGGVVINKGDFNYVKEAHEKGYKVWGLIDNSFNPEITSEVLNSGELKDKVIAQIAFYASLYNLDGINIDFENIYYEDKDAFVAFVEDLTHILKKQNLIVSIDVTVPSNSERWSKVYDRERLGAIVDYVILMAYDEHWSTSPVSGSVASIGWVERGIQASLNSIPREKLILGIPFYTRVWKETKDEKGDVEVSSKAVPIKNVEQILDKYDAKVSWDEAVGQYFATYEYEDALYKIWIEDTRSIQLKLELANKYDLKGIASWRKGYEYEEVWEVINTIVDEGDLL